MCINSVFENYNLSAELKSLCPWDGNCMLLLILRRILELMINTVAFKLFCEVLLGYLPHKE